MTDTHSLDKSLAYSKILTLLQSGEVEPGTKLSERKVSEMIGVGRVPVREAIKDLHRLGVIEVNPAKGSFLKIATLAELQDTYEVRLILEVEACVIAAQKHADGSLDGFEQDFRRMIETHESFDIESVDSFCSDFHEQLLALTDNPVLIETFKPFKIKNSILFKLPDIEFEHRKAIKKEILEEHLLILEAVKSRDIERCRTLMKLHLKNGFDIRKKYISQ